MSSILNDVKSYIGFTEDYDVFDRALMISINTRLMVLSQVGCGPDKPYAVTSSADAWEQAFPNMDEIQGVISYICIKTRLEFDPPQSSYVLTSLKEQASELEWRLGIRGENGVENG